MDRLIREFYKKNRLRKRRARLEKIIFGLHYQDIINIDISKPTRIELDRTTINYGDFIVIRISRTSYWERIFVGRDEYEHYRGEFIIVSGRRTLWELIRKGKIEDIV